MMKWWGWGDDDKHFSVDNRPGFWPFYYKMVMRNKLNIEIPVAPKFEDMKLPAPRINKKCLTALQKSLAADQVATDNLARLQHAYGRNYRDLLRIWENKVALTPDVVVYPHTQNDVINIMTLADQHQVIVIPYGGGTNVVGALEVVPGTTKMVISVDMQRMNKVISINKENSTALIEAGALGKDLESQLNEKGYSLGHFPDSFEFSSLGGWIAMRSSGMQSDSNGNIENMLISSTLVTPKSVITTPEAPRFSSGPDINEIILGSEGIFGIITQAVVKIIKLKKMETRAYLFPNFEAALQTLLAARAINRIPKMFRISDSWETLTTNALSPKSDRLQKSLKKVLHYYLIHIKKIKMEHTCLSFITFNPNDNQEKKDVMALCKQYGAINLGTGIAEKWFETKYAPPYLRDLFMEQGVITDSIETSVSWDKLLTLHDSVIAETQEFFKKECDDNGFIFCHVSHSYANGACLYFTLCAPCTGDQLTHYLNIKKFIVDAIIKHGGTVSHHHSIGCEHLPWVENFLGASSIDLLKGIKKTLDPDNICNPGKLIPSHNLIQYYWPNVTSD